MNNKSISGIDDDGATQIFGRPPPIPRSDTGDVPITFEYGRRSGHWTSGETVFSSGVDDGCLTVIHSPRAYGDRGAASSEGGRLHPLSAAALKKLKKASEEDEKKKLAARAAIEAGEREKAAAATAAEQDKPASEAQPPPPKGFYVPKPGAGIKIVSKDGKSHVVVRPHSLVKAAAPKVEVKPEPAKTGPPPAAPAPVPETPPKPASKAPSAVSKSASSVHRRVRIVGKNGEEAFVELPFIRASPSPATHVYVPANAAQASTDKKVEPPANVTKDTIKKDKAQEEQKAAKAAKELRAQREQQEREEKQQRERQAKAAADVVMSGGLGGSWKSSSAGKPASPHTAKSASSRSASVINGVFDNTSKPPSKASSRTMTPPPAHAASIRAVSNASTQRAQTVSVGGWQSAGSKKAESQKPTSNGIWQGAAGFAAEPAAASRAGSAKPLSHAATQRSKSASQQDWQALGSGVFQPSQPAVNDSWKGADAIYKTSSPHLAAPSQVPPSIPQRPLSTTQRQKASTPPSRPVSITSSQISRKIAGIHQWNHATPTVHSPLPSIHEQPTTTQATPPLTVDVRRANAKNASQDTIFAGTGWISPHPLSRAPSEFEPPPQDKITIAGAEMTYEEYRRLQEQTYTGEGGRRNFSRTSSEGRTLQAGQWGRGNAPASLGGAGADEEGGCRNDSGSGGAPQAGQGWENYHVPTVVSEHSQRSHRSVSHTSRIQSVQLGSQRSAGASTVKSFDDPPPQVGQWDHPEVDGPVSVHDSYGWAGGEGQLATRPTWREPQRMESPVVPGAFGGEHGNLASERGQGAGSVQLRMPWDREAVVGSQRGAW